MAVAALMIAAMVVGIGIPTLQLEAMDPPANGDADRWQPGYDNYTWYRPNVYYHDDQGNFTSHSPHQRTFSLPMNVDVRGRDGDSGHLSNGIMWLNYGKGYWGSVAQAERVYVKLALNEASSSIPSNTCRISIATQWLREGANPALSSSYSYMEFDIWHNPGWRPEYYGTAINWYAPDFWMPTIEVKHDQMEVGTTKEYIVEAKSYFEEYYPGVKANMTAAYIVVCKVFTDGWLDVNLDILDIAISSDPCLVEPDIPPLFPEGRLTGIYGLFSKSFLYAKEAVVLGRPLSSSWSSGLDLSAAQRHRDVGDRGVL
jgi:hypothetical protein